MTLFDQLKEQHRSYKGTDAQDYSTEDLVTHLFRATTELGNTVLQGYNCDYLKTIIGAKIEAVIWPLFTLVNKHASCIKIVELQLMDIRSPRQEFFDLWSSVADVCYFLSPNTGFQLNQSIDDTFYQIKRLYLSITGQTLEEYYETKKLGVPQKGGTK